MYLDRPLSTDARSPVPTFDIATFGTNKYRKSRQKLLPDVFTFDLALLILAGQPLEAYDDFRQNFVKFSADRDGRPVESLPASFITTIYPSFDSMGMRLKKKECLVTKMSRTEIYGRSTSRFDRGRCRMKEVERDEEGTVNDGRQNVEWKE